MVGCFWRNYRNIQIRIIIITGAIHISDLENIMKEYNLNKEKYGLEKDNINIWFINEEKLEKLNPDEIGFNTDTFNEVIGDMNNLYQDLFYN